MVKIVATPEQAELLRKSNEQVVIVDSLGQRLGSITPEFSAEEISQALKRASSDEPRRTTEEVLKRLRNLEVAE